MISGITIHESGFDNRVQIPVSASNLPEQTGRSQHKAVREQKHVEKRASSTAENQLDQSQLNKYTEKLSKVMEILNHSIRFAVDDDSDRMIVKIVNSETNEVIRQIPPKEVLQLMHRLDQMVGLMLDEKV
jgi:flagellar protein FlaG